MVKFVKHNSRIISFESPPPSSSFSIVAIYDKLLPNTRILNLMTRFHTILPSKNTSYFPTKYPNEQCNG